MKIFYAGTQYDHYDKKRGLSFEHENLYRSLQNLSGVEVVYFPFERILQLGGNGVGRRKFNQEVLDAVKREKPDVLVVFMYSDEFEPATLEEFKKYTTTIAWFADDSWRFFNYSKFWAKYFSYAITTYSWMPPLYQRAGQPNVIRSQWGVDSKQYYPTAPRGTGPDVAFVGGWTEPRQKIISYLESRGIKVAAYGGGWSGGRISQEDMLRMFSSAKINLALNPAPGYWNVNSLGRLVARPSVNKIVPDFHWISNFQSWLHRGIPQVKARHFEIPACGGFMMTGAADDLDTFYIPGTEIAFYKNLDDMAAKIKYYLEHEDERTTMAEAAYRRTIREHTYVRRFEELFTTLKESNRT